MGHEPLHVGVGMLDAAELGPVLVAIDDVAVNDSLDTAGHRCIAGTVLVEKAAGAVAESGDSLDQVANIAETVSAKVRSRGVAGTPGIVPDSGGPSQELGEDELKVGIGIHDEPGCERIPLESVDRVVDCILSLILADLPFSRGMRC